jgi:phosphoglycolate phosphatase
LARGFHFPAHGFFVNLSTATVDIGNSFQGFGAVKTFLGLEKPVDRQSQTSVQTLRAVIFDFDGTLIDSYQAITASVNHVRAAYNLPPLSEPEVRRCVGRGPAYLFQHTVPGGDLDKDMARYRAHHPSVLRSGTRLLPGVVETLHMLSTAGFPLAVCSNKPGDFTRQLLGYLGLAPLMEVVIGPEDARKIKPAPDMLLAALKRLDVAPSEALYVGDMVVDIQTARAAGVRVWVIPTGSDERSTLEAAKPDRVLASFAELGSLSAAGFRNRGEPEADTRRSP